MQSLDLIHPEMANVPKTEITSKLAKTLKVKEDCISIYGLKTKFGGGSSTGFALVYDSADARAKYDNKSNLRRVSSFCNRRGSCGITERATAGVCVFLLSRQSLKTNKRDNFFKHQS